MNQDESAASSAASDEDATGAVATWGSVPRAVRAVIFGIFVNRLGGFLQAFLVLFLMHTGYDAARAGIALGCNGAGAIAGILASAWLVDRAGMRRAVAGSMALTAVLTAGVLAATSYGFVLVVVTALGTTSQIYRPASAQLLSTRVPARRQIMVFAMYRLAQNLGTTAAPLLGAALVAASYPLLFWVEAAAALACAAITWWALPADPPTATRATVQPGIGGGYLVMVRDVRFTGFLLGMLVYAAVYVQYVSVLPLAVQAAGWSTNVYAALISVNGAMVITCELWVTRRVQHWGRRAAALCGIALVSAGLACYALPLGIAGLVLATVVWSLGETVCSPTMVAYPARAAQPDLVGRYLGASQAVFGVGTALGPTIGVLLWEGIGSGSWPVFGIAGLLAAAGVVLGMREDHAELRAVAPQGAA
ncbi:MFS transporter [Actinomadura harenae]|nr:MFS transporter [Actinomadura harenae]